MPLGIVSGVVLMSLTASARGQAPALPPPTDGQIEEQVPRLDPKNDIE